MPLKFKHHFSLHLFCFLLFLNQSNGQSKVLQFENLTLEQAAEKAKTEGKMVFIDCHTAWSNESRAMELYAYSNDSIVDFFSKNFVCISYDLEMDYGKKIKKKFEVLDFPTFLFLKNDGTESYRQTGLLSVKAFLELGSLALRSNSVEINQFNKAGQKNGLWVEQYPKGGRKNESWFENGLKTGYEKTYFSNGLLSGILFYKDGIQTGFGKHYLYNEFGTLHSVYFSLYGMKDSLYTIYNEGGTPKAQVSFSKGSPVSGTLFYENGQPSCKCNYRNGLPDGRIITFYENQKIRMEEQYQTGLVMEILVSQDSAGQPLDKGSLSSGTGVWKSFYPDGEIEFSIEMLHGMKHGKETRFHPGEIIWSETIYEADRPMEALSSFDSNGKPRDPGNLKGGNGTLKVYDNQNFLKKEIHFEKGKRKKPILDAEENGPFHCPEQFPGSF